MNVKRVTLTGSKVAIEFPNYCSEWLVKNFGSADIFVSFEQNTPSDETIKISSGMGQIVTDNKNAKVKNIFGHKTLYISGTGEVEVQQICYR